MLLQVLLDAAKNAANQGTHIKAETLDTMSIYLIGVVAAVAFLLIAILVANLIKFEPGSHPKDPQKRRIWFWILGVLAVITTFVLLYFVFMPASAESLKEVGLLKKTADFDAYKLKFNTYNKNFPIATGVCFVVYVVIGFILSKVFKSKKIGNWF